ncbi:uncharacterized protein SPPG_01722 [Spizellomyces punctatus DAOM BR117]|uniref:ATP-dependent RNA helicase DED1 n=1 Tax=Spizellomyces punctatus (strain DAOM BR117) TaxID=645134 RepID=A0A0L0HPB6_SPIPD|nr:uncharacterized protein SPPG_01722 [Spizellomyces punctatus DAOM BR117]KND02634.1 hypothetical protein SPPG_01722 [Spizellomyces punctatus DAOM BR117]|eukprot:XP_016610673.1 hypothetical protein SPPG_01722 [Spizellomyces punctatus DAOM BR117]
MPSARNGVRNNHYDEDDEVAYESEYAKSRSSTVERLADEFGSRLSLADDVPQNSRNARPVQKRPWTPGPRDSRTEQRLFSERITEGINFEKYDEIPVSTAGYEVPAPIGTFEESTLHQGVKWILKELAKYNKPTPVQRYAIPISSAGRDLMACAQTGSGKTAAYLLPIISNLFYDGPGGERGPSALILAPTRELAMQIHHEAKKLTYRSFVKAVCVYGGQGAPTVSDQAYQMQDGCDLLIATTGRLMDHLERGNVTLTNCRYLVLDEADRMLDMGFEIDVRTIVQDADMPEEHQTALFSATFPKEIQMMATDFLNDYIFLTIGQIGSTTSDIKQIVMNVPRHAKRRELVRLLQADKQEAIRNQPLRYLVLIFVATKREAAAISYHLESEGFRAGTIHGDLTQSQREQALAAFKSAKKPILVATDVAQRGLDIPNVMHVIQYDLPNQIDDHVHRIGRTGRAGNLGKATAFWNPDNFAITRDLVKKLQENKQIVPEFLRGGGGGGFGGGASQSGGGSSSRSFGW